MIKSGMKIILPGHFICTFNFLFFTFDLKTELAHIRASSGSLNVHLFLFLIPNFASKKALLLQDSAYIKHTKYALKTE